MSTVWVLVLALVLDALFGEPRWLWSRVPHPAVVMGRLIGWWDGRFNDGTRTGGIAMVTALVIGGAILGLVLAQLGWIVEALIAAILLAQRSLVQHVSAVARELRLSVPSGRRAVAMIVSRDTLAMDPPDITRAAIESAAENLSDGVIAPAFWFAVAGLPGILIYKAVNTADSMVGYRTERHEAFGWAAARLDDLLNWIPARITAALLWLAGGMRGAWGAIAADAAHHKSPNAGWPEAAMARALDIALAGPRRYHGHLQDLPWVHPAGAKDTGAADIDAAAGMLWRAWGGFVILCTLLALVFQS